MPNFPFTANIKWDLKQECIRLFGLHERIVESGFPLSHDEVVAATIPAEARNHLIALKDIGAKLWMTHHINAIIEPHGDVDRGVLASFQFRQQIPYLWEVQSSVYEAARGFDSRKSMDGRGATQARKLPFNLSVLSEERLAKLDKWLAEALLQRRRGTVACDLATTFLTLYCNSTGELLARWPGMRVLFKRLRQPWPSRIHDAPSRNMSRWNWSSGSAATFEFYLANERKILAADALLQAAAMFDANQRPTTGDVEAPPVTAHITAWDKGNADDRQR